MEDLVVDDAHTIPASELKWRFEPSGKPGGQHANRSATRAVLSFDVARSAAFDEAERNRILERLAPAAGVIVVEADRSRSQWRNRRQARARLAERLREALAPPPPPRRPTRPSAAARRRRLDDKRRRAALKRRRRPPTDLD